jgi:TrmH family RNA methyltransferase
MPETISSLQNPRVKEAIKLRQRRDRDRTKLFIIEGYREILYAVKSKVSIEQLFYCPDFFLGENEDALITEAITLGAKTVPCSPHVFEKLSYRDRPDGLLAVAKQLNYSLDNLPLSQNPFLVVAEAIEKPGNLGTILRSSDAVNVDGLIVCDRCTDIHNPNVVRASVGTLFTRPVIETSTTNTLAWLKKQNIAVLAATPSAAANFTEVDLSGPVAIVVGTEQYGLSEQMMNEATLQVRIPMMGQADSLNVAMATTLLLYETLRQRGV